MTLYEQYSILLILYYLIKRDLNDIIVLQVLIISLFQFSKLNTNLLLCSSKSCSSKFICIESLKSFSHTPIHLVFKDRKFSVYIHLNLCFLSDYCVMVGVCSRDYITLCTKSYKYVIL